MTSLSGMTPYNQLQAPERLKLISKKYLQCFSKYKEFTDAIFKMEHGERSDQSSHHMTNVGISHIMILTKTIF